MTRALVFLTALLIVVSFPHALEDFHYGEFTRLGVPQAYGVLALAIAYAAQVAGVTLLVKGRQAGAWLLALTGAVWAIGATVVHGHDLLFAGPGYRHGLVSRALEVGIILTGTATAILGCLRGLDLRLR